MSLKLPRVDLAKDSPEIQARTIKDALGTIGFFEVCNSGLTPDTIQQMFDLVSIPYPIQNCSSPSWLMRVDQYLTSQTKELFQQPQEVKEAFPADAIGSGYYKPHEQALGIYKRDNKE